MKALALSVVAAISLAAVGCAIPTSSYTVGRDFPSENVSKITKEKTTSKELIQMFGEPHLKVVVSESEEKWIYTYTSGTTNVQRRLFTADVHTTGQRKMLDVLMKNGIVTNFTYTDSPEPFSTIQVK